MNGLQPYHLTCNRPPLSSALGWPDFYPVLPDCSEQTLNAESLTKGYKDHHAQLGISEAAESSLSLAATNSSISGNVAHLSSTQQAVWQVLHSAHGFKAQTAEPKWSAGVVDAADVAQAFCVPATIACGSAVRRAWIQDLGGALLLPDLANGVPDSAPQESEGLVQTLMALSSSQVPVARAVWFLQVLYCNKARPDAGADSLAQRSKLFSHNMCAALDTLLAKLLDAPAAPLPGAAQAQQQPPPELQPLLRSPSPLPQQLLGATDRAVTVGDWQYALAVAGWMQRQGLLSNAALLGCALAHLQDSLAGSQRLLGAWHALLPLLRLCVKGPTLPPQLVQGLATAAASLLQLAARPDTGQVLPPGKGAGVQ